MSGWMAWRGHAWLGLAARLYLGGVFLLACAHKILHPEVFAVDVATYQFLPLWAVNLFAITLPWVELAAGLLLVLGVRSRAAALLVALMMLAFLAALGSALGLGVGLGGLKWLASLKQLQGYIDPVVSPRFLLEVFLAATVLGVCGSFYPAWRTTRLRAVEALKYE